jgi:regulator of sigma E protease
MGLLHTLFYFAVAIGLLVAVHEFGHFWVARKVGIKVIRFSIGFGKVLWSHQKTPDSTEYALSAIPLGGYVKMVDEREGEVKAEDLPFAFNRQSVAARTAVVAAGPLFNLLLAILLYWAVFLIGETGMKPIIGAIAPNTLASQAGLKEGEEIIAINDKITPTWQIAIELLMSTALDSEQIKITVKDATQFEKTHFLPVPKDVTEKPEAFYQHLGLKPWTPVIKPVLDKILPGSAAEKAGLHQYDWIRRADGVAINDWQQWVAYVQQRPTVPIKLQIERNRQSISATIIPQAIVSKGKTAGKIGASVYIPPSLIDSLQVTYSLPVGEAFVAALDKTYYYSMTSLSMIGKMLVGHASTDNLSGPISIAQYAGQTAEMGLVPFFKFLALVSLSLGVLNLLPVPVLDGGHLLFFAIEAVKGSPLPEKAQLVFQNIGLVLLMSLMLLAVFLDIGRLFH